MGRMLVRQASAGVSLQTCSIRSTGAGPGAAFMIGLLGDCDPRSSCRTSGKGEQFPLLCYLRLHDKIPPNGSFSSLSTWAKSTESPAQRVDVSPHPSYWNRVLHPAIRRPLDESARTRTGSSLCLRGLLKARTPGTDWASVASALVRSHLCLRASLSETTPGRCYVLLRVTVRTKRKRSLKALSSLPNFHNRGWTDVRLDRCDLLFLISSFRKAH